jgi:hypothetical protein
MERYRPDGLRMDEAGAVLSPRLDVPEPGDAVPASRDKGSAGRAKRDARDPVGVFERAL